jgi:hypothetical protein
MKRRAQHLFKKYRWMMVGTIVPTDKETHEDHDIPFLKLSNRGRNGLERGWFCQACLKLQADRMPYYVQCTALKDKKQVSFLSINNVGRMSIQKRVQGNCMLFHEHKLIMFQITMRWTETIGIAQTTRQQSARTDFT